ncbi:MAG: hypothetical protein JNJ88_21275 [Planctomycetes bacterium]|nr:hypothetical protein [Planctomycetota bacterium]
MSLSLPPSDSRSRVAAVLAFLCIWLLFTACALDRSASAPAHGWSRSHGAVIAHDTFPADCTLCHLPGSWRELRPDFAFDHAQQTGYALEGAHRGAQCLRCHNDRGPVAQFSQRGCAGCHVDQHRGKLGPKCEDCHGMTDWRAQGQTASHARTRFPLVGAHLAVACFACHPNAQVGNFQGADTACQSCHIPDYLKSQQPNHVLGDIPRTCEECHDTHSWRRALFSHSGIGAECVVCHLKTYKKTSMPNHAASGISMVCSNCHGTNYWVPLAFNHTGVTEGCAQCHMPAYLATTMPNHMGAGYPTTCEDCHSTNTWLIPK